MPFLIRLILQRVAIAGLGFLSFLGVSPEVSIPTQEQVEISTEERQDTIDEFFTDDNFDSQKTIDSLENLKEESEKELQRRIDISKVDNNKTDSIPPAVQNPIVPEKPVTYPKNNVLETNTSPEIVTESPVIEKTIVEQVAEKITNNTTKTSLNDVVFNILCLNRVGNQISAHAGSGVVISDTGVVLTNAHVAQYFLLVDEANPNYMDCTLYRENIPSFGYKARLLYIPSDWVRNNYKLISSSNPRGTGEGDFALLTITGNSNPSLSKPRTFNFANPDTNYDYEIGNEIQIASYPGAPKNILDLARSVGFRFDTSHISDVYTLSSGTIDVFSTGTTDLAQKGSSGGGIFSNGNLIGTIVTTSNSGSGFRINAIATSYVNNSLKSKTGTGLKDYISGNTISRSQEFFENDFQALSELVKSTY